MRIEFSQIVSLIIVTFCVPTKAVEFFIYMPNTIIAPSIVNIPIYISRPPAIVSFTQDRNHNGTQMFLLTKTFSEIPILMHGEKNNPLKKNLEIKLYSCKNTVDCSPNKTAKVLLEKTYQIPLSKKTHFVVVFPSKQCYKAKEKLIIHIFMNPIKDVLKIHDNSSDNLEWKNGQFTRQPSSRLQTFTKPLLIDLYDDKNKRVAHWNISSNVTSSSIEYMLPKNISTGIWRIDSYFPGKYQLNSHEFQVSYPSKDSVLTNAELNVAISFNDDVTINSKDIAFTLCASYSKLRSVKGTYTGSICLKNNDEESQIERPCIKFQGVLNGSRKCVPISHKTTILDLKNATYTQQLNRLNIFVEVVDDYSKKSQIIRFIGPTLENSKYKIVFLSDHYFKSLLPYYGKIRTLMHNGKPYPNASVMIQCNAVNFPFNWGHISRHVSDGQGFINFILSSPPNQLSVITCDIEDLSPIVEKPGTLKYYRPSITQTLEKWKTESSKNVQLRILQRELFGQGTERLQLQLQSNEVISDDLVVLLVANGQLIRSRYITNKDIEKNVFSNRNDELGHYVVNPADGRITCTKGWTGKNCLTPLCSGNCNHGICVHGNFCFCKYGWTGQFCNKCVPHKNCVNGYCIEGNDCVCQAGWIGSNCDIEGTEAHNRRQLKRKVVQRSAIFVDPDPSKMTPIFTTNITWQVPTMITKTTVLVYTVSKIPSSSKLTFNPLYSDIKEKKATFDFDGSKCVHFQPKLLLTKLIDNLITIDPSQIGLKSSIYDKIVSDQCRMPFQNFNKINSNAFQDSMMSDFSQIEHYDFLNTMKSLEMFSISTMKVVSRTCPIWKILSAYNKSKNPTTDKPKRMTTKSPTVTNAVQPSNFYGCNGKLGERVFVDFDRVSLSDSVTSFASICTNGSQPVFIRNHNLEFSPTFLVTIGAIDKLQIREKHQLTTTIFNLIDSDLEIELISSSDSNCLTSLLPERSVILVKSHQSLNVTQEIQFDCFGVFELLLSFSASRASTIYPNMTRNETHRINHTESVIYNVIPGITESKIYNYQFCQNETINSTVSIGLVNGFHSEHFIELQINVQSSLEALLDYLKYIFNHPKMRNIIALTMEIYEINLNKLLRNKKYLNQSLISIKRMMLYESEILRNITRSLTLEYEISLINLCSEIPNVIFSVKRQFCEFVQRKISTKSFNKKNCTFFLSKPNETMMLMTFVLSQSSYRLKIFRKQLFFVKRCLTGHNDSEVGKLYQKVSEKFGKDPESFPKWFDSHKDSLGVNKLLFVYFILRDKLKQENLRIIIKALLQKIQQKPKNIPKLSVLFLWKLFSDFEERFQPNNHQERTYQSGKLTKSFLKWPKNKTLSIELPKFHACFSISVKARKYLSSNETNNPSDVLIKYKNENCRKGTILISFEKDRTDYNSLSINLPTGWMLGDIDSAIAKCNLFSEFDGANITTKLDLHLIYEKCLTKQLLLPISQYQGIDNIQPGYVSLTTKQGQSFSIPMVVNHCKDNPSPKMNSERKVSKTTEDYFFHNFHFQYVNITNNKTIISLDSQLRITVFRSKKTLQNRIKISIYRGVGVEVSLNSSVWWFMSNYGHHLSNLGQLIANIISTSQLDKDLFSKNNIPFCTSLLRNNLWRPFFYENICKNLTFAYVIKSFDLNNNLINLQLFADNCDLNSKITGEFPIKINADKSFSSQCQLIHNINKRSKESKYVIFSTRKLIENNNQIVSLNNSFLIVEFHKWV